MSVSPRIFNEMAASYSVSHINRYIGSGQLFADSKVCLLIQQNVEFGLLADYKPN